ncbi:MAG: rhomboid family intramembrane serine protease [Gemmatimonadaceae bacterium]
MFPIGDENPTIRTPVMTFLILGALLAVWVLVQGAGANELTLVSSVCNLGLVPGELTHRAPLGFALPMAPGLACLIDNEPINRLTPLTSMFLHGSWGHIISNSLFLWVFGNNVEDSMGRLRFLLFYLLCGLAAAATHVLINPASPVPTVGASGAISGVLGAYLVLYPRVRVRMLFPPFFIFHVVAWIVLLYWFGLQVLTGLPELNPMRRDVSGGVAVWAHVGGFVTGVLLVKLFENPRLVRRRTTVGDARAVWDPTA